MKNTLDTGSRKSFSMPPGIVFSRIDTKTGLLASRSSQKTRLECFVEGTEPKEFSPEEEDQAEVDFFKEEFDSVAPSPTTGELAEDLAEDLAEELVE
jgi:penicillin-binding protein 1A